MQDKSTPKDKKEPQTEQSPPRGRVIIRNVERPRNPHLYRKAWEYLLGDDHALDEYLTEKKGGER